MKPPVLGSDRGAAIKADRYGVKISATQREDGWYGTVVRRADEHVVHEVGAALSSDEASTRASRWADAQAATQGVDEWINEHKTSREVVRAASPRASPIGLG